jgi:hypothetical protein
MKWFLLFLGFCVLIGLTVPGNKGGTSPAPVTYTPPPPGLVVSKDAALKYLQSMIIAHGHRCQHIHAAHLWAAEEGGSYTQVGCDVLSNGEGLWYAVHTNARGTLTAVDAPRTTALFPQ